MILQALEQYYRRKSAGGGADLPPFGFETKEIPVIIELNAESELVQLRVSDSKTDTAAAEYLVPQGVKKTSGIMANLFWDNAEYALGIDCCGKPEKVAKRHQAFIERLEQLPEPAASDQGVKVLRQFLRNFAPDRLQQTPHWELLQTNPNISFRLQGDSGLICQRPSACIQPSKGYGARKHQAPISSHFISMPLIPMEKARG
jgi:CRISPR-associated protein Csd1